MIIASGLLFLVLALCYGARPDRYAAVTFWPAFAWPPMGLFLAALGVGRATKWLAAGAVALWLLFALLFVEEAGSLLRSRELQAPGWQTASGASQELRVISFNCLGKPEAAAEVLPYQPDIVLLQESPPWPVVDQMARALFSRQAGVVTAGDCTTIVRGIVSPIKSFPRSQEAQVRLASGLEVHIFNVHLSAPVAKFDVSSAQVWREQRASREVHRAEMLRIVTRLEKVPGAMPLIMGGDFNVPAGDAVLRPLKPRLHDTFRERGIGWGNTVLNEFAILRIDQVWTSKHFRTLAVAARRSQHSDHRIVICDLVL